MLRFDPDRATGTSRRDTPLILYIEGPGDRNILRAWAYRLLPSRARGLFRSSVILGGRQPARALEHFRRRDDSLAQARALCVLDRDDGDPVELDQPESGFELFTWGRRHIESYLLVPDAILRALDRNDSGRVERILRDHLPADGAEEQAYRGIDAKRLLGRHGPLHRAVGRPLPLAQIARATRESELHPDVHALFDRIRGALGEREPARIDR